MFWASSSRGMRLARTWLHATSDPKSERSYVRVAVAFRALRNAWTSWTYSGLRLDSLWTAFRVSKSERSNQKGGNGQWD